MFEFGGTSYASIGAKPAIKKCADKISRNIEKDFLEIIKND
jgi:hydroxymethylpyrimidine pyrophosphatase-like HAD family hydrolase